MTSRDDLRDRLDDLEGRFGVGPTACVITGVEKPESVEWPDGVSRADITVSREEEGVDPDTPLRVETVSVPLHRPPEYRGGVVVMSDAEVARVYDRMPDDVRERELEHRVEQGEPIPPILQR